MRPPKKTSVSKAMLGQIERGESSPTVTTLWKLANGSGVPFSSFFGEGDATAGLPDKILSADGEMEVTTLYSGADSVKTDFFKITLSSRREQKSRAHPARSIEHVVVLKGSIKVFCDDVWHILKRGDSLRFNADQPHRYAAISNSAVFHNIIHYF